MTIFGGRESCKSLYKKGLKIYGIFEDGKIVLSQFVRSGQRPHLYCASVERQSQTYIAAQKLKKRQETRDERSEKGQKVVVNWRAGSGRKNKLLIKIQKLLLNGGFPILHKKVEIFNAIAYRIRA
jgi:hypothetical protein